MLSVPGLEPPCAAVSLVQLTKVSPFSLFFFYFCDTYIQGRKLQLCPVVLLSFQILGLPLFFCPSLSNSLFSVLVYFLGFLFFFSL